MEIDEDLGLASCGADAPDNTYKGVREIEVAVIVGSHAVEPCTHGESCKDLFGLIRVHHIDYGILSNRIIGDIQVAGVVVDDQAGGEASEGAVKGSISRLCARGVILRTSLLRIRLTKILLARSNTRFSGASNFEGSKVATVVKVAACVVPIASRMVAAVAVMSFDRIMMVLLLA